MVLLQTSAKNMEIKKQIRKEFLKKRKQISISEWQQRSKIIQEKLLFHPWFQSAENVYCYMDYNSEVATREIIEECWRQGKNVWIPKIEESFMEFYQIRDFRGLIPESHGILEPETSIKAKGQDGLMILPGVGFDLLGNRLGYGGGYYDRYLERYPHLKKIALAFDLQIQEEKLPFEATDIRPDYIITETRFIKTV